jgi:hypothetical protein
MQRRPRRPLSLCRTTQTIVPNIAYDCRPAARCSGGRDRREAGERTEGSQRWQLVCGLWD